MVSTQAQGSQSLPELQIVEVERKEGSVMHIFTESVLRHEHAAMIDKNACRHKDAQRFQRETEYEWHSTRAILRTWLLAFAATGLVFTVYICFRALP